MAGKKKTVERLSNATGVAEPIDTLFFSNLRKLDAAEGGKIPMFVIFEDGLMTSKRFDPESSNTLKCFGE